MCKRVFSGMARIVWSRSQSSFYADFRTFLFNEEFGGFEGCKSAKQVVLCEFIHSVCRVQLPHGAFRRLVSLSTRSELAL